MPAERASSIAVATGGGCRRAMTAMAINGHPTRNMTTEGVGYSRDFRGRGRAELVGCGVHRVGHSDETGRVRTGDCDVTSATFAD